jgi:queuine tRNA-ribosyltransferase
VVRTRAGALAVRSLEAGEVMHPGVGPLAEARELYVGQSRLGERLAGGPVVLFDVGLGAGSNALAARAEAERAGGHLTLVSFERDLGALELALAHGAAFGLEGEPGEAARALLARGRHDSAHTSWRLEPGDVLAALARQTEPADLVFWDPFSPRANPALWTAAAFAAARRAAGPGCTLYTYSASTAVRVAMLLGGWAVGRGDSVGDKAQTTAAAVRSSDLARPLDRAWLRRLSLPGAPLPADAPPDAAARLARLPQFENPAHEARGGGTLGRP